MPFDFNAVTAPFRMQPGLRPLAVGAPQLTPSRPGDRPLAEKLAVLTQHADQALVMADGFDAAPALRRLCEHAAAEQPQAWRAHGTSGWEAPLLRWSVDEAGVVRGDGAPEIGACLQALPAAWRPPALLSLAFAEDFAVIDGHTAQIPWLAVCLPSHWAPQDKVGRHFAEVHAPVADNRLLLTASEHLAKLVTGAPGTKQVRQQIERWKKSLA